MAYEYEHRIQGIIWSNEDCWCIDNDKESNELREVYAKAKAFDTFIKYKEHVEKYNNSDCHELERVFEFVMKEYEEDK